MQSYAVVVFFLVVAGVQAAEMMFDAAVERECQKIHAVSDDEVNHARTERLEGISSNLKSFIKCYMEKSGMINSDGIFQPHHITFLPQDKVEDCKKRIGAIKTEEEAANMRACLIDHKITLIAILP